MAQRTLPGLGLTGFWDLGFDGWKAENDENLLALSVLVQSRVLSRVTALPGSPTDGDIYIVPAGGDADKIAVRDDGAWVYYVPAEGYMVYVVDDAEYVTYDGADWVPLTAAVSAVTSVFGRTGAVVADASDYDADQVDFDPTGLVNTAATDVQTAIADLDAAVPAHVELSFFAGGEFTASEVIFSLLVNTPFTLPINMAGSQFVAGIAATASTVFDVEKNGVGVGTATWAIAGTVPTLAMASPTAFTTGDLIQFIAPATPDATLADISGNFLGDL